MKIGIVGGSDYSKIAEQLGEGDDGEETSFMTFGQLSLPTCLDRLQGVEQRRVVITGNFGFKLKMKLQETCF